MTEKPKWIDLWGSNPELKAEEFSCCRKLEKYEAIIERVCELAKDYEFLDEDPDADISYGVVAYEIFRALQGEQE